MTRRTFLAGTLAGLVALWPVRAVAHHKPGHRGGPPVTTPPSSSTTSTTLPPLPAPPGDGDLYLDAY
jgi:hypothetical protein